MKRKMLAACLSVGLFTICVLGGVGVTTMIEAVKSELGDSPASSVVVTLAAETTASYPKTTEVEEADILPPESYTLAERPFTLFRVHFNEGQRWVADEKLSQMIVGGGNALDDPQSFPQGCEVVAYSHGPELRFLVEKDGRWQEAPNGFQPLRPFYLCLWHSGWHTRTDKVWLGR